MAKGNAALLKAEMSMDTTDFKTGTETANRELRVLESGFKSNVASLGDWSKSSEALESRLKNLGEQMVLQKGKVEATRAEWERVAAEQGANSRAAEELEIKLNKETETLGKMKAEVTKTDSALGEMGDESGSTAKDLSKVDDEAKKAEKSTKSLGEQLKDFGKGIGSAVSGVAKAFAGLAASAVAAVGALGALVMKSTDAAGELVDMSAKTGFTVTQLQEFKYVGDQIGVGLDTITGSASRFTNAIEAAAGGTGPLAEDMALLGVSVYDANGNLRDSKELYQEALNGLGGLENETQKEIVAQNLFGKSYQELMPLINTSAEEMAKLTQEGRDLGAVMSEEAVYGLEAFGDEIAGLKSGLQGSLGTIAAAVLPAFQSVTGIAKGWMGELAEILSGSGGDLASVAPKIGSLLGKIFTDIAAGLPDMVDMGLGIVQGLVEAIVAALPNLVPAGLEILKSLIGFIATMAPMLIEAGVPLILQLVKGIVDLMPQMVKAGTEIVLALVLGLGQMLPELIKGAFSMIITLITGLTAALPQLMAMVVEMIPQIIIALLENLPLLISAALELIIALATGLATALPVLISYVPEIVTAIFNTIVSSLPKIIEAAGRIISALLKGLVAAGGQLFAIGAKILEVIKSSIDGKSFAEIGKNIVLGIWEGIKGMWTSVTGWFSGLLKGLKGTADAATNSHSPSRLFAEVGMNIGAGLGVGINDSMNNVKRDLRKAMADLGNMNTPTLNLGDHKSQTEILDPENMIRRIVREESGTQGNQAITINFAGSLGALMRELKPYADRENVRVGGSLISRSTG